jgi:hypothetical protein
MMILTKQSLGLITKQLGNKPLSEQEIRKVEGIGGLYMTLHRLEKKPEEEEVTKNGTTYWFHYTLRIEGDTYHFYGGEPSS